MTGGIPKKGAIVIFNNKLKAEIEEDLGREEKGLGLMDWKG